MIARNPMGKPRTAPKEKEWYIPPWEMQKFDDGWCLPMRAAKAIGISVTTIYKLAREKKLRTLYFMRFHLVNMADVRKEFDVTVPRPEVAKAA